MRRIVARIAGFSRYGVAAQLALLQPLSAFAIPEQGYEETFSAQVAPFYARGVGGSFRGTGGVRIRYRYFESRQERGAVVVLGGKGEPAIKYSEVAYDLHRMGYPVYLYDHRGHGSSGAVASDPQIVHVESFQDYVDDLGVFVSSVVRARSHSKLFLLAHSMGATIGALYLVREPAVFDAAALSAPMFRIDTGKFPEPAAYLITRGASLAGMGEKYAKGHGPHDPSAQFESNKVTRSQARWKMARGLEKRLPEIVRGGVSNRWAWKALDATRAVRRDADRVVTPVLLMQAGIDHLVKPAGQDRFCDNSKNCEKVVFPDSLHEILMERDAVRNEAFERIARHFAGRPEVCLAQP